MNLSELIEYQRRFDSRHGWGAVSNEPKDLVPLISKDLIGLIGEVGEFANLLKKIQLLEPYPEELEREWVQGKQSMKEELIDAFIYFMRIAVHLDIDLEACYQEKMVKNEERFKKFEK